MKILLVVLLSCTAMLGVVTGAGVKRSTGHGDRYHRDTTLHPGAAGGTPNSNMKKARAGQKSTEDKSFWKDIGQTELNAALAIQNKNNVAKNVILFLGDGLGNPTVVASRIYKAQQQGENAGGEEGSLVFETFEDVALSKTYCVDKQVADSACTATAYLTGVKTKYRGIGVDASVTIGDCASLTEESKVPSIAKWALDENKRAGFVTSTRVTHATPAGSYAHSPHRDFECDAAIENPASCPNFKDIGRQLVEDEPGNRFNVIMGGGYQQLVDGAVNREELMDFIDHEECIRGDGLDLFKLWQDNKAADGKVYKTARTKSELMDLDLTGVEYLMGVFANDHVPWEHQKRENNLDLPTLAEMTDRALDVLEQEEAGYFLLVEGGRIDHAHHDTTARRALDETVAFEAAIQLALNRINTQETLVVVTADHSHVMTINGYPTRGNDILGLAGDGEDNLPYTTLMYTNGEGFNFTVVDGEAARYNLTGTDTTGYEYLQLTPVPRSSETHGGEDVPIYATGPWSHLFRGVHEQNYIAHAIGYAACIGPRQDLPRCAGTRDTAALALLLAMVALHYFRHRLYQ